MDMIVEFIMFFVLISVLGSIFAAYLWVYDSDSDDNSSS